MRDFPISKAAADKQTDGMDRSPENSGHRALRRGRASLPGHYYVITSVCCGRHPHFACAAVARAVADKLRESSLWSDATPVCRVLMPDHLHALIALGAVTELSSVVRRLKCVTALAANRVRGADGPLGVVPITIIRCGPIKIACPWRAI
jgi:REP element-mobilizing transposase RayT